MHRLGRSSLLALLILPLLAGCPTIGTMQTARTAGEGNLQMAIEPSFWGSAAGGEAFGVPGFNFAARYGVSDTVDIGGRIGTSLIEFTGKFRLTDPADQDLIISLAPSAGGFVVGGTGGGMGVVNVQMPVLLGLPVGGSGSELVVGPKVLYSGFLGGVDGASAGLHVVTVGASFGFAAQLGDTFRILPEIALAYPIFTSFGGGGGGNSGSISEFGGTGGLMFQVGVAMLFGGD